ncbi:MAG TPA: hypothetical protein DCY13_09865 [Verrucomicrobiales bacterium]|nr:hypothetical protein [Verrucomicrobiales bacterium]
MSSKSEQSDRDEADALLTARRSVRRWRALAMSCLLLAGCLIWLNWRQRTVLRAETAAVGTAGSSPEAIDLEGVLVGPWGKLEVLPITLERPDALLREIEEYYEPQPWRFGEASARQIFELFAAADLLPSQRAWLQDGAHWHRDGDEWVILPPDYLILELKPEARGRIYRFLGRFRGNPLKEFPFSFPAKDVERWFTRAGLSSDTTRMVNSLLYPRGDLMCFSDLAVLRERMTPQERTRLVKTMSKVSALQVRLRVPPGAELAEIASYWNLGADGDLNQPLMDALTRLPEGGHLDISYLLPAFARERLYRFPDPETNSEAKQQDCFWTAMNFRAHSPESRFLVPDNCFRELEKNYDVVAEDPKYGDVMVLVNERDVAVHAFVYVAGDIVFSKNGGGTTSPWSLMKLSDMMPWYTVDGPLKLHVFRQRTATGS